MSGVLKVIGKVAGVVAAVAGIALMFVPGGQVFGVALTTIAMAASAVSVAATMAASMTAKKPPAEGSVTGITIGANQPSPYIIGESYYGGNRVAQVGYGTEDKVKNSYAWFTDIYSVGGPLALLVGVYTDFTPVTWTGTNADGYYHNNLHVIPQLGATNEPSALVPHWAGTPDWGSDYKLSGLAAIGYNARFPYDGKVYQSGFPQTGAVWRGQLSWDPRADDTFPGGSGDSRWADPADTTAFHAAKATWTYNNNPGLQALRYLLGVWERDEDDTGATYKRVFGVGGKLDQIVVDDFVELANICDANLWTVNGVLAEGAGISKWDNFKRIIAAGGAEPVFRGGKLGLKFNAPLIALDTITRDDLAEGTPSIPSGTGYRDRKNTLIPKYHSKDNKWEIAASNPVQVTDYVTQDGEVKSEEITYDLVTGGSEAADQAAQLTAYELVNRREQGPITLPLKPRMRLYRPGQKLSIDADLAEELGIRETELIITARQFDPAAMSWSFTFITDTPDKHSFALSETGTAPPATSIHPVSDAESIPAATASGYIRNAYVKVTPPLLTGEDDAGSGKITIADHSWDYPVQVADIDRTGGVITGLDLGTRYYVYFDDDTLADPEPTYHASTTIATALNSAANPYRHYLDDIDVPGSGDPPSSGSGSGGGGYGGGGCPCATMYLRERDRGVVAAPTIAVDDYVWGKHEITGVWGWYRVSAVQVLTDQPCVSYRLGADIYETSASHLNWANNGWRKSASIPSATSIGNQTVYLFTVEDAHTYELLASADAAQGVLSHNKLMDPSL